MNELFEIYQKFIKVKNFDKFSKFYFECLDLINSNKVNEENVLKALKEIEFEVENNEGLIDNIDEIEV